MRTQVEVLRRLPQIQKVIICIIFARYIDWPGDHPDMKWEGVEDEKIWWRMRKFESPKEDARTKSEVLQSFPQIWRVSLCSSLPLLTKMFNKI